jgi:hypothetical protein
MPIRALDWAKANGTSEILTFLWYLWQLDDAPVERFRRRLADRTFDRVSPNRTLFLASAGNPMAALHRITVNL